MVSTIIRIAAKNGRVNALLEEKGCNYRITGIDVENGIHPKAAFSVEQVSE